MYEFPQLLAAVMAAALASVGLWTFGGKIVELVFRRKESREDELRGEVRELKARHETCERDLAAVKERLAALEHHHASFIPRWLTDARKRIVWVNSRALITVFAPLGYSRDQVEGCHFQDLLDVDAAGEIDRLDTAALAHPGKPIGALLQLHPELPPMHVVKIAGTGRQHELIYEGCAFPVTDPRTATAMGKSRHDEQRGASMLRLGKTESEEEGESK